MYYRKCLYMKHINMQPESNKSKSCVACGSIRVITMQTYPNTFQLQYTLSGSLVTMACPQVVDGGESLQIWRAAANILNKQLRTADKG
jgi:hypothetical protein